MRCRILGALLWGVASVAAAADVTVQPVTGSGFVVKDSGGATDRFRVQDNGQVSLPAVPAAATQAQSLCIAASGLLGPCAGGGQLQRGHRTGADRFDVLGGGAVPAAAGVHGEPGSAVERRGVDLRQRERRRVAEWQWHRELPAHLDRPRDAGELRRHAKCDGNVGIGVAGPRKYELQVGDPPGFSGNQLALGNWRPWACPSR